MQTSAISYRVADFLKQHPPFHAMEETDLLALAARGRVKFHEVDEYVCWQGTPHGPFVFVIQQGTVSLWEETGGHERLRDIRGAGDMLAIDRYAGAESHLYSAKTSSDVVVYALSADDFAPLLEKYPHASRYVAASASVSADYQAGGGRREAHQSFVHDSAKPEPLTCRPGEPIREAARKMAEAGVEAIAVTDDGRRVRGVITAADILKWIGQGHSATEPVDAIMSAPPVSLAPDAAVSQAVLAMAEAGADFAVATIDGTAAGALHSLITPSDLAPVFGEQPIGLLREISRAASEDALRAAQSSVRAFVLDHLASPSSLDWLARFAHRADVAAEVRRLAWTALPPGDFCLCFAGAAGRRESLTTAPRIAVILGESCDAAAFTERFGHDCVTVAEWKQRFTEWVENPILSDLGAARPLFDLRPVHGASELYREVDDHLRAAIAADPNFLRILAHDCMGNLPPLTFYRDQVVEGSGEHSGVFELERRALRPLVDVGRVFGVAAGRPLGGSTLERFELARTLLPDNERVFREAADTLRVVLYHQARAGIRSGNDGFELQPSMLSRHDRQVLKTGFRAILQLLEFTSEWRWLDCI